MAGTRAHGMNLHGMRAFGLLPSKVEMIRINALAKRHQPQIPFPHKHSFFQIVIITRGQGWHEIDFTRHDIAEGLTYIVKPGQVHAWDLSLDTTGFLVEFEFNALKKVQSLDDPLTQLYALPDALRPAADQQASILRLCHDMLREQEDQQAGWQSILPLELLTLLLLLFRFAPPSPAFMDKDETLQNFFNLVNNHYARHHTIEFYAEKLDLTPKALTMRVTRAFGSPPKKIIQDRCLLEAKRLLAYSADSSAAIARKIGFEDPNYFVRLFRSKTGMTPTDFRASQHASQDKFPKP